MAAYIDLAFLESSYGTGWINAVRGSGVDISGVIIPTATAIVQNLLRARGFLAPSETTDYSVMAATGAAVVHHLSTIAEVKVDLPDTWAAHPHRMILDALADASDPTRFQPDPSVHPVEKTIMATGGVGTSEDRVTTASGARPARANRSELSGY